MGAKRQPNSPETLPGVKVNDNRHYMATLIILVTQDSNVQGCWSDAAEEWALCVGIWKRVADEFNIFKTY